MYTAKDYRRNIRGDLFGGITAAIVALPLALAFGISSGVGAVAGLYGAAIAGFFAAVFGGTPSQISGPTGPMTVIITGMTANYLALWPDQGLALVFTTVFLGGCMQSAIGLLRLGKFIIMVPYPVISGFMTGIGAIIILIQLGPLLGFPASVSVGAAVAAFPEQLLHSDAAALSIGGLSLAILFLWRGRPAKMLPAPLVALVLATMATYWFPDGSLDRIGTIPSGLPALQIPTFRPEIATEMLINALMLAVLGSIDSLLTSLVADNLTGTQHNSDRELLGQGLGNALAGLFGGIPGAGATMRTVVNIRAGGSGPLSGAFHALILLAVAAGLGFLFESIPLAALAGILIKVGIDIVDWPFMQRLHRLPLFPVALMLLVLLLTVFADLITAVFVGVFIKNLVTVSKLSDLELGNVVMSDGSDRNADLTSLERELLDQHAGSAVLLRITGPVSYAVGRGINARFEPYRNREFLYIDITDAAIVGISTAMVLEHLILNARANNVVVKLIGVDRSLHQDIEQLGIPDIVGRENCLTSAKDALERPHT
ncbi:SulP family inorganic anion transporter [Congregibacter sp.]|uniref:SulP family inorganic anion transporter n=1 Tax=Congregibacter sp. TaxID=2744308 RepID=UPI003F6D9D2C